MTFTQESFKAFAKDLTTNGRHVVVETKGGEVVSLETFSGPTAQADAEEKMERLGDAGTHLKP